MIDDAPVMSKASGRRQDITLAEESFVRTDTIAPEAFADGDIVPFFDIERRLAVPLVPPRS